LLQCKSIDKPYLIPDDFSLEKHFGQAWRMMPSGTLHDIHLHFDPKMAETVADTHWHDSQDQTFNENNSPDSFQNGVNQTGCGWPLGLLADGQTFNAQRSTSNFQSADNRIP
jgi:hypothetical protein